VILWFSEKKNYMALIFVEVEYVTTWSTCGEAPLLHKLIAKLFDLELQKTCIFYDY
jgi:hypothetical protein